MKKSNRLENIDRKLLLIKLFHTFMTLGFMLLFWLCLLALCCRAQEPAHVMTSYLSHEDATQWYHAQTMSDGSRRTQTIKKPVPPVPWASWHIIATNELPVQVQYVYEVLRQDSSVFTNTETRIKSARERIDITLLPMPDIKRPAPGRADAYAQTLKRAVPEKAAVTEIRIMEKRDLVMSKSIVGDDMHEITTNGKLIITPIKRAFTARVKNTPKPPWETWQPPMTEEEYKFMIEYGSIIRGIPSFAAPDLDNDEFNAIGDPTKPNKKGKQP